MKLSGPEIALTAYALIVIAVLAAIYSLAELIWRMV